MTESVTAANRAGLRIGLGVRPPRVAIGVPAVKGISWPRLFEIVIATQTRVWGGIGNLPFPLTNQFVESDLFWALAKRFDADAWATYVVNVGDMETLDPRWHEADAERIRKRLHDEDAEGIERYLHDHRETEVIAPMQPDARRAKRILEALAPLHHGVDDFEFEAVTSGRPSWPLVDAGSFRDLPQVTRNPATRLGPVYRLLLTTEFGRILPEFQVLLNARQSFVSHEPFTSVHSVVRALFGYGDASALPWPWPLSEAGLASYQYGSPSRAPVVLVTGDSSWDFTLFYALRRWTSRAYWLPTWLNRSPLAQRYLLSAVDRLAGRNTGEIVVVTTSRKTAFRDEVAGLLRDRRIGKRDISTAGWAEVLPERPDRLFERGNFGIPRQLVPMEGQRTTELPTPLPRRVACEDPSELRWLADLNIDGWTPLRHPAVSAAVLDAYPTDLQRASDSGVAYYCPNMFFRSGSDLETITIRPRLTQLSLLEQLRLILEPKGWRCDVSDKGIYAAETAALFKGLDALARELRDPDIRSILHGFVFDGAGIEVAGGRRCLSQQHVDEIVEGDCATLVDGLVERGILSRGLVLKCLRCRQSGWYSLDDLGREFGCRRCRLDQAVEGRWRGGNEPAWFYELAEVVHQFMEHGGDIPVLASDQHFGESTDDVNKGIEVLFFPPEYDSLPAEKRRTIELDIVAAEGHRLWLGEAAKNLRPSIRRLKELRRLARDAGAHGFLFATAQPKFSAETATALRQFLQQDRCDVVLMTDVRSGN